MKIIFLNNYKMNRMIVGNYVRYKLLSNNLYKISGKKQLLKTLTINNHPMVKETSNKNGNSKHKSLKKNDKLTRKEPENIDINDINFSEIFWNNHNKWKDSK